MEVGNNMENVWKYHGNSMEWKGNLPEPATVELGMKARGTLVLCVMPLGHALIFATCYITGHPIG